MYCLFDVHEIAISECSRQLLLKHCNKMELINPRDLPFWMFQPKLYPGDQICGMLCRSKKVNQIIKLLSDLTARLSLLRHHGQFSPPKLSGDMFGAC